MKPTPARNLHRTDGTLTVREPRPSDAPGVAEAVRSSLRELAPFMPWATDDYGEDTALQWIRGEFDPAAVPFVVLEDDRVVGSTGIHNIVTGHECGELGYWLRSDRTGRGLAARAAAMVCEIGFDELGLHRIEMLILALNTRSIRVAEKLGATYEGIRRERIITDSGPADAAAYALLATDRIKSPKPT